MSEAYQKVDIVTLGSGSVVERINMELRKIFANISDINTDPKASRELQLKIKFVPTEDRQSAGMAVSCSSKLVSGEQLKGRIYLNGADAFESKPPVAGSLFDEERDPAEVSVSIGDAIMISSARRKEA